ncbi:MAG: hypothetical protein HYU03_06865, partial [Thaumarchaeota archaeon]|nr:hypothetical protein [Nitrososphaerota archaeon]
DEFTVPEREMLKSYYQKLVWRSRNMTGCRLGGYDSGDFGFGRAKPVEVGKEPDVMISAIIERGDGIARIQCFRRLCRGS